MRNYAEETEKRVQYIRQAVADAHADGILFGNSGGKDSALVGILCKMACEEYGRYHPALQLEAELHHRQG